MADWQVLSEAPIAPPPKVPGVSTGGWELVKEETIAPPARTGPQSIPASNETIPPVREISPVEGGFSPTKQTLAAIEPTGFRQAMQPVLTGTFPAGLDPLVPEAGDSPAMRAGKPLLRTMVSALSAKNLGIMAGGALVGGAAATATSAAVRQAYSAADALLSGYFAYQSARGAVEGVKQSYEDYKRGDYASALGNLGAAGVDTFLGFLNSKAARSRYQDVADIAKLRNDLQAHVNAQRAAEAMAETGPARIAAPAGEPPAEPTEPPAPAPPKAQRARPTPAAEPPKWEVVSEAPASPAEVEASSEAELTDIGPPKAVAKPEVNFTETEITPTRAGLVGRPARTPKVTAELPQAAPTAAPEIIAIPTTQPPSQRAAAPVQSPEDARYAEAVRLVREAGRASTSTLQRNLRLGYGAAAAMLDRMEQEGIIGPADGSKPRAVLPVAAPVQTPAPPSVQRDTEPAPLPAEPLQPAPSGVHEHMPALISALREHIAEGKSLANGTELQRFAKEKLGGSLTEGTFEMKDAYDALETAVNQHIAETIGPRLLHEPVESAVKELEALTSRLPTQTARNKEQLQFQQFSTPPALSYLAATAANISPGETVLEPSAGTGSLAAWANAAGAKVETNELSPRRKGMLEISGYTPTQLNAERINDLRPDLKPDVVLMNPPFSAAAGRLDKNKNAIGYAHVLSALRSLKPDGRLVAILGEGARFDAPTATKFWDAIRAQGATIRANVGMSGENYRKYGTTFGNRLLVVDKAQDTTGSKPIVGDYNTVSEAYNAIEPILERTQPGKGIGPLAGSAGYLPAVRPEPPRPGPGGNELNRPGVGRGPDIRPAERPEPVASAPSTAEGITEPRPGPPVPSETSGRGAGDVGDVGRGLELQTGARQPAGELDEAGTYETYRPAKLRAGMSHQQATGTGLVETANMAAVEPPDITYKPSIDKALLDSGKISDAQLEAIVYAGQAHTQVLPGGLRAGYMCGDGTGVGKGTIAAGIALDNWNKGRKKILWLSLKSGLVKQAQRDLDWVNSGIQAKMANDFAFGEDIKHEGVLFSSYKMLQQEATDKSLPSRLDQILKWKPDVILADESHAAKNAVGSEIYDDKGEEGTKGKKNLLSSEGTKSGQALLDLDNGLKDARVAYFSATAFSSVRNLGYANRLGLWGKGTDFPTFRDFLVEVEKGGLGVMEMIAGEMKAQGRYAARQISFDGVDYREVEAKLTPAQRQMYDSAVQAWQAILSRMGAAIEASTGGDKRSSGLAKASALKQFWGKNQAFYRQLLVTTKIPTVIAEIEKSLADGKSIFVDLVSTGEAEATRQMTNALANDVDYADMDMSAKQMIQTYLDKSFPIYATEDFVDESGITRSRSVVDAKGDKVVNQEALAIQQELKRGLDTIRLPKAPLDELIDHFGADNVAEISGRKMRIVEDPNTGKPVEVKRLKPKGSLSRDVNEWERRNFMTGRKRIAIASGAGGTGFDFHSDRREPNQQRRVHLTIEPSWSADAQMQKFGRTHRTNQSIPPEYVLVATDMGGEKRFISAIASRLASLGALTRGERRAGGASEILAKYNLESEYGQAAVDAFLSQLSTNASQITASDVAVPLAKLPVELEQFGKANVLKLLGFSDDTDTAPVGQFLNRMLNVPTAIQSMAFDHFMSTFENIVTRVKEAGAFDEGTLQLKALSTNIKSDKVIRQNPGSAPTRHVVVDAEMPVKYTPPEDMIAHLRSAKENTERSGLYRNIRSGALWAIRRALQDKFDQNTGTLTPLASAVGIRGQRRTFPMTDFTDEHYTRESPQIRRQADLETISQQWQKEIAGLPTSEHEDIHVISGSILGGWKTLSQNSEGYKVPVVSVRGQGGEPITGIRLPEKTAQEIVDVLSGKADYSPKAIFSRVWDRSEPIDLTGARLQRSRMFGEPALVVMGGSPKAQTQLAGLGLKSMDTAAGSRFYIPISPEPTESQRAEAISTLEKVLKLFPPAMKEFVKSETGTSNVAPVLADLARTTSALIRGDNYSGLGAMQSKLVRNLSQTEKASTRVFEAAVRAAASRAQASTILRAAVPRILSELKGGQHTWQEVRLAMIESRLRGIRDRWLNFAEQALTIDADQFEEALNKPSDSLELPDTFMGLLQKIQGKRDIPQDVAQTAAALVEAKDWPTLRTFLNQTFRDAAAQVKPMMEPELFDFITSDPHFQRALGVYKRLVEKPMAENHELNEGVFSTALGPLDTYYPLIPTDRPTPAPPGRRLPYYRPRNIASAFATGLAEEYDAGMEALKDRLFKAVRANDKAALIDAIRHAGLSRKLGRSESSDVFEFRGQEYPAAVVETSPQRILIQNGRAVRAPSSQDVMPAWLERELRPILERERLNVSVVNKILNGLTKIALAGPADFVFHTANLMGTLVANTPFLDASLTGKALSNPFTKKFYAIAKVAMVDPTSEEAAADLVEMAKIGLVPDRYASVTFSRRFAEETGAAVTRFSFAPALFGPKGIDVRARLVMYRVAKQINPGATPRELYHFVNQLGNYVPALQAEVERALKGSGFSPFYTAGSTMLRNGINAWLGTGPQPVIGKTRLAPDTEEAGDFKRTSEGTYRIWQQLTGGAIVYLALWALTSKAITGQWPWDDKRSKLMAIPAPNWLRRSTLGNALWGRGGEVGYVNFGFFNPSIMRGARAMGIPGAYETMRLRGSVGQAAEAAQRDIMNAWMHPVLGPTPRAAFVGATGDEPYITSLRDRQGRIGPQFMPAISPKTRPGWPTLSRRAAAAALELNAFYGSIGESTGMLGDDRGRKGNQIIRGIFDLTMPGLIGNATNPYARAEALRRQRAGSQR